MKPRRNDTTEKPGIIGAMDFVTLHELARELNKPEKTLRYQFKNLLRARKLTEGSDFIKDSFRDEQHFVYKINPTRFLQETGHLPDPPVGTNIPEVGYPTGTKVDEFGTSEETFGTKENILGTQIEEFGTKEFVEEKKSEPEPVVEKIVTVNNEQQLEIQQDYIEVLKKQLEVKDKQIGDLSDQLKDSNKMTNAAMGEVIQLNRQLQIPARADFGTKDENVWYQNNEPQENFGTKVDEFGTKTNTPDSDHYRGQ